MGCKTGRVEQARCFGLARTRLGRELRHRERVPPSPHQCTHEVPARRGVGLHRRRRRRACPEHFKSFRHRHRGLRSLVARMYRPPRPHPNKMETYMIDYINLYYMFYSSRNYCLGNTMLLYIASFLWCGVAEQNRIVFSLWLNEIKMV